MQLVFIYGQQELREKVFVDFFIVTIIVFIGTICMKAVRTTSLHTPLDITTYIRSKAGVLAMQCIGLLLPLAQVWFTSSFSFA